MVETDGPVTISGRVVNGSGSDQMQLHWYSYTADEHNGMVPLDGEGKFSFSYTPNFAENLITMTTMGRDGQVASNAIAVLYVEED